MRNINGAEWFFIVFFGMFLFAVIFLEKPKSDAQIVCELSHSADVCFQALNR